MTIRILHGNIEKQNLKFLSSIFFTAGKEFGFIKRQDAMKKSGVGSNSELGMSFLFLPSLSPHKGLESHIWFSASHFSPHYNIDRLRDCGWPRKLGMK